MTLAHEHPIDPTVHVVLHCTSEHLIPCPTRSDIVLTGMYVCTKPKGAEQRSRKDCLPDCKKQCAKTDAQLMKGIPKVEL
jgi:hypothetical protein